MLIPVLRKNPPVFSILPPPFLHRLCIPTTKLYNTQELGESKAFLLRDIKPYLSSSSSLFPLPLSFSQSLSRSLAAASLSSLFLEGHDTHAKMLGLIRRASTLFVRSLTPGVTIRGLDPERFLSLHIRVYIFTMYVCRSEKRQSRSFSSLFYASPWPWLCHFGDVRSCQMIAKSSVSFASSYFVIDVRTTN